MMPRMPEHHLNRRPLPFEVPRPVPVLLRNLDPTPDLERRKPRKTGGRLRFGLLLLLGGLTLFLLQYR